MDINVGASVKNRFDIEVRSADTGELKQSVTTYNTLLNRIYDRLCNLQHVGGYIAFGSGTTQPQASDTGLTTFIGSKSAGEAETSGFTAPATFWAKFKIKLNPEEYVGQSISEVGIAFGSSNGHVVTKARLQNAEGGAISIQKTALDVVIIYATVYLTINAPAGVVVTPSASNYFFDLIRKHNYVSIQKESVVQTHLASRTPQDKDKAETVPNHTADVAQRRTAFPPARHGVSRGNGNVRSIWREQSIVFDVGAEQNFFQPQTVTGVKIGVGDGVKTMFHLPSQRVVESTITAKVDGVTRSIGTTKKGRIIGFSPYSPLGLSILRGGMIAWESGAYGGDPVITIKSGKNFTRDRYAGGLNGLAAASVPRNVYFQLVGSSYSSSLTLYLSRVKNRKAENDPSFAPVSFSYGVKYITASENGEWFCFNNRAYRVSEQGVVSEVAHSLPGDVQISPCGRLIFSQSEYALTSDLATKKSMPSGISDLSKPIKAGENLAILYTKNSKVYRGIYDFSADEWTSEEVWPSSIDVRRYVVKDDEIWGRQQGENRIVHIRKENGQWKRYGTEEDIYIEYDAEISFDGEVFYGQGFVPVFDPTSITEITFSEAPAVGAEITADYQIKGIHKTDQYVLDCGYTIQWGEGA